MMDDFDLFLASSSERRAQLLRQVGIRFRLVNGSVDETRRAGECPATMARRLAVEKAEAGVERLRHLGTDPGVRPVLGADTVVVCSGEILGKPLDAVDAFSMLQRLSGVTHRVVTAVALRTPVDCLTAISETLVSFRNFSDDERHQYIRTGEPMGKAGAYAIQGLAACLVEGIQGSYSGVVGLPLLETCELLSRAGIHCLRGQPFDA